MSERPKRAQQTKGCPCHQHAVSIECVAALRPCFFRANWSHLPGVKSAADLPAIRMVAGHCIAARSDHDARCSRQGFGYREQRRQRTWIEHRIVIEPEIGIWVG